MTKPISHGSCQQDANRLQGRPIAMDFMLPDEIAGVLLPDAMTRVFRRSKQRAPFRGGNRVVDTFITPNTNAPWLYYKSISDNVDKKVDKTWDNTVTHNPCFENDVGLTTDTVQKAGVKAVATAECGVSVPEDPLRRDFTISNVHVLIARMHPQGDEDKDGAHTQFMDAAKTVCDASFAYHCGRPPGKGGINAGYFDTAWGDATHLAFCVCDNNANGFIALGFALLRDYSDKDHCFTQLEDINLPSYNLSTTPRPRNVLYIDIVCSKLSMAQPLIKLLCSHGDWKKVLFGQRASESHYVFLRGIPTVYTYYPVMYGFVRSIDNKIMFPIFKITTENLQKAIRMITLPGQGKPTFKPDTAAARALYENFADAAFGNNKWVLTNENVLYVYTLDNTFTKWLKSTTLQQPALKRLLKLFESTEVAHDDSDINGYLYGFYVTNSQSVVHPASIIGPGQQPVRHRPSIRERRTPPLRPTRTGNQTTGTTGMVTRSRGRPGG